MNDYDRWKSTDEEADREPRQPGHFCHFCMRGNHAACAGDNCRCDCPVLENNRCPKLP